jgi:hypothetical protein
MRPGQNHRHARRPALRRAPPASDGYSRLGADFELFSDRTEDAVERENLIHDFESIREADIGSGDVH